MQQIPPLLNPPIISSSTVQMDSYPQHVYYLQPQNPMPNSDPNFRTSSLDSLMVQPPGVDPSPSIPGAVKPLGSHVPSGYETSQLGLAYSYPQAVASASASFYQDPNAAITPYGLNSYAEGITIASTAAQKLVTANSGSILWTNSTTGSHKTSAWKKGPKKIKVVQSAWCEICRVDCNSKNVLDQHKLGKKHKKNLEKLIVANRSMVAPATLPASVPPAASTVSDNPEIGPEENPGKAKSSVSQNGRKKAADAEDLETKRKKIVEGGAAVDAVRTCAICNVVCNSETVFRYHLAGQKHAAMMKKHGFATGMAAAT